MATLATFIQLSFDFWSHTDLSWNPISVIYQLNMLEFIFSLPLILSLSCRDNYGTILIGLSENSAYV